MKNLIILCQSYILESQVEGNWRNQIIPCQRSTKLIILQNAHITVLKRAIRVGENKIIFYFLKIIGELYILFGDRAAVVYIFCLQTLYLLLATQQPRRLLGEHR
jgi:hypothetical protein